MQNSRPSSDHLRKWGGIASFVMVVAAVVASMIYFTGNLRDAMGAFSYSMADLLYGPVFAVSLVTVVSALRERIGSSAPRRMNLALMITIAAAFGFVLIAMVRSANRQYHLLHPEMRLESSTTVLTVWTTLVTAITSTSWHALGWVLVLLGWSAWSSKNLPRLLSALYLVAGIFSLLVYIVPVMEGNAFIVFVIVSLWQGFLLLASKTQSEQTIVVQEE